MLVHSSLSPFIHFRSQTKGAVLATLILSLPVSINETVMETVLFNHAYMPTQSQWSPVETQFSGDSRLF